jgi:hypothetical protein
MKNQIQPLPIKRKIMWNKNQQLSKIKLFMMGKWLLKLNLRTT